MHSLWVSLILNYGCTNSDLHKLGNKGLCQKDSVNSSGSLVIFYLVPTSSIPFVNSWVCRKVRRGGMSSTLDVLCRCPRVLILMWWVEVLKHLIKELSLVCIKVSWTVCHQSFKSFSPANHQSSPGWTLLNADNLVLTTWNHDYISSTPFPSLSLRWQTAQVQHFSTAATCQIPDVKIYISR